MSTEQFKREWIEKIRKEDERWVRPRKARQTRGHERGPGCGAESVMANIHETLREATQPLC